LLAKEKEMLLACMAR